MSTRVEAAPTGRPISIRQIIGIPLNVFLFLFLMVMGWGSVAGFFAHLPVVGEFVAIGINRFYGGGERCAWRHFLLVGVGPDGGDAWRTIARPMVVLPHPDSPTRPSVSPARRTKETPSTARISPT